MKPASNICCFHVFAAPRNAPKTDFAGENTARLQHKLVSAVWFSQFQSILPMREFSVGNERSEKSKRGRSWEKKWKIRPRKRGLFFSSPSFTNRPRLSYSRHKKKSTIHSRQSIKSGKLSRTRDRIITQLLQRQIRRTSAVSLLPLVHPDARIANMRQMNSKDFS